MEYKTISSLHYITPNLNRQEDYLEDIERTCKSGIPWVQLRMKEFSKEIVKTTAILAKEICTKYKVTLIINDHPEIAHEVKAHGVHVGKEDADPAHIRQKFGPEMVIGATANSFKDVQAVYPYVDYIGLGPFRFTSTKKKLSPILGENGYLDILQQCAEHHIKIPIVAIGGIQLDDLEKLKPTGVHGVAVSGLLHQCSHDVETINEIKKKFDHVKNCG